MDGRTRRNRSADASDPASDVPDSTPELDAVVAKLSATIDQADAASGGTPSRSVPASDSTKGDVNVAVHSPGGGRDSEFAPLSPMLLEPPESSAAERLAAKGDTFVVLGVLPMRWSWIRQFAMVLFAFVAGYTVGLQRAHSLAHASTVVCRTSGPNISGSGGNTQGVVLPDTDSLADLKAELDRDDKTGAGPILAKPGKDKSGKDKNNRPRGLPDDTKPGKSTNAKPKPGAAGSDEKPTEQVKPEDEAKPEPKPDSKPVKPPKPATKKEDDKPAATAKPDSAKSDAAAAAAASAVAASSTGPAAPAVDPWKDVKVGGSGYWPKSRVKNFKPTVDLSKPPVSIADAARRVYGFHRFHGLLETPVCPRIMRLLNAPGLWRKNTAEWADKLKKQRAECPPPHPDCPILTVATTPMPDPVTPPPAGGGNYNLAGTHGHRAVASSLIRGLKNLGVPFDNDPTHTDRLQGGTSTVFATHDDYLALQMSKWMQAGRIAAACTGPNVGAFPNGPDDTPSAIYRPNSGLTAHAVPSDWVATLFELDQDHGFSTAQRRFINVWPIGLDTEKWSPYPLPLPIAEPAKPAPVPAVLEIPQLAIPDEPKAVPTPPELAPGFNPPAGMNITTIRVKHLAALAAYDAGVELRRVRLQAAVDRDQQLANNKKQIVDLEAQHKVYNEKYKEYMAVKEKADADRKAYRDAHDGNEPEDRDALKALRRAGGQPKAVIYSKDGLMVQSGPALGNVGDMLRAKGFRVAETGYGGYSPDQFRANLLDASVAVWVASSESQSVAMMEAWSMDVPTLVWTGGASLASYQNRGFISTPESEVAAPYLTEHTGRFFRSNEEFLRILDQWKNLERTFFPRQWMKLHMTDAHGALYLLNVLRNKKPEVAEFFFDRLCNGDGEGSDADAAAAEKPENDKAVVAK